MELETTPPDTILPAQERQGRLGGEPLKDA